MHYHIQKHFLIVQLKTFQDLVTLAHNVERTYKYEKPTKSAGKTELRLSKPSVKPKTVKRGANANVADPAAEKKPKVGTGNPPQLRAVGAGRANSKAKDDFFQEKLNKKYPFSNDDVEAILDQLLEHAHLELLPIRRPAETDQTGHPKMWEFSVGLYMINIWPDSLLLTAIYGVAESASIAVFGPLIGNWLDRVTYVKVLRVWLLTQNLSFMVAGGAVAILLFYNSLKSTAFMTFMLLIILVNVSGAVGVLSSLAGTILVEREWVVVIASGQPPGVLTEMNSVIRRIDLSCKLLAPVFTGFIVSFVSLKASAVALALWNVLSIWLQYLFLIYVYHGIPALSEPTQKKVGKSLSNESCNSEEGADSLRFNQDEGSISTIGGEVANIGWKWKLRERLSKIPCIRAWIVYAKQEVVLPGVALSLLYFTVLSFGTLMTATLEWEGIPAYVIGLARGISAVIGIGATVVYPILHSYLLSLRTGLWSIWAQWCFLLVCVASIWVKNSYISAWMLMGGVAMSRLGLWMFDLAVIQQMQDSVTESDRFVVGGVQNSLQSMMDLLSYIMGIIISNPKDFGKLSFMSFLSVTLAAILYTFHVHRVRRHIFHFDKLFPKIQCMIDDNTIPR